MFQLSPSFCKADPISFFLGNEICTKKVSKATNSERGGTFKKRKGET